MRATVVVIFLTISYLTSVAQPTDYVDELITQLNGASENISKDSSVIKLIKKGEVTLPTLSKHFTDTANSSVFSNCVGRLLTKGEIAIIIADRVEGMPYYTLTEFQNCTLETCKGNPNLVEYYLNFIKLRGMTKTFKNRYDEWLKSSDRKKYRKAKSNSF